MPYPLVPVEPEAPLHDLIDILSRTTAERAVEPHPQGHHKRKDACTHHGQRTEMPVFAAVGKTAEGTEGIFQGVPSAEMAVRGRDTRRTVLRPTCWSKEQTWEPYRNCWVIMTSRPHLFIFMWRVYTNRAYPIHLILWMIRRVHYHIMKDNTNYIVSTNYHIW